MRSYNIASSIVLTLSLTHAARAAEEAYYRVPVAELNLVEGKLPAAPAAADVQWDSRRGPIGGPRVLVDGAGRDVEAYLVPNEQNRGTWSWGNPIDRWTLTVRAPQGREINGRLVFARPGEQAPQTATFTIASSSAAADHRDAFLRARLFYYDSVTQQNVPGAAWFRFQANASRAALSQPQAANEAQLRAINRRRGDDLSDTYALFSGGRAVSENLQLDRALPPTTQPNREGTPTASIRGVTVKEIDWAPLVKDAKPQLDPLVSLIPADQHAIFFPSAAEAMAVLELAERHGTPALQSIEPQAESARLRQRYERQLCRSAKDVLSLSERSLVGELAVTGSDPYLRVGTDIALLIQTSNVDALRKDVVDAIRSSGIQAADADVDGLKVTGGANEDRSVSAYFAVLGEGVVVLANSREQLRRLAAVRNKSTASLAAAPEYVFFRNRYRRGEGEESALFILSDATIRRWCGPRWRIGDSRRTRAAAILADRQAAAVASRAGVSLPATQPTTDRFVPDIGEIRTTDGGVTSATYNTLAFMTPIAELELEKVTTAEADAYGRWRDGYQRNWSWAFDPIALRVSARPGRVAGDVTVMPLIDASRYRSMIETSRGASIAAGSGDPHDEALAHLAYAVNVKSQSVRSWATSISQFAPQLKVNALDWLGPTVALYADADPFWADLAAAKEKDDFFQQNLGRLPVGLYAQVQQPLKLAALLTTMRAFVDQAAPGLTQWQTVDHDGQPYVKITANVGAAIGSGMPPIAICYVATPESFTLTLNEELLKRAIDRQRARSGATTQAASAPTTQPRSAPSTQPWLGQNLAVHVDRRFVDIMAGASDEDPQRFLRSLAWGNIPILNEWRRLYPDRDPLDVHEQQWHVRLLEPAGGTYRWNEQWQTMESSVYGHPAEPKDGPVVPPNVDAFKRGSFGIDFEEQGIRARAEVTLNPTTAPATQPR